MSQEGLSEPPELIRVLHIDDEPAQLSFAKRFIELNDPSITVESARSQKEANKLLEGQDFDCIVSDYQMPDLDGIALARTVRETSNVPFIIYTGRGSEEVASEAFAVGVDDYLQKRTDPSHYQVLAKRIRTAVERHRAQRMLVESQRRLEEIATEARAQADLLEKTFDSIGDAIFILNADYPTPRIIACNRGFENVFGYIEDEIRGQSTNFIHVDDETHREFQSLVYPATEKQFPIHIPEFRMKRKDGSVFASEHWLSQLVDDGGERIGWVSITRDITDRKKVEEELRESEERYKGLVEQAPDAIVTLNMRGAITSVNSTSLKMTGYDRAELVGKHFSKLGTFRPSDLPGYLRLFTQLLKGETPEPFEIPFYHKDGSLLWGEVHTSVLEVGGRRSGIQVIWRDTTERRRIEEDLKRSEERYRSLVEVSPMGVMTGNLLGFVASVNPAVLKLTGYSEDEIIGKHFSRLGYFKASEIPKYVRLFSSLAKGVTPPPYEFPYVHKDGSERWARAYIGFMEEDGKRTGIQTVVMDITEQKEAEEQLKEYVAHLEEIIEERTQELLNAERISAAGRVATTVGHDLRGPLQTIKNAIFLIERTPERAEELRGTISDAVDYANGLLEELRHSTMDAPLQVETVNIANLVQRAIVEASIPDDIETEMHVEGELEPISIDQFRMRRVLDNLIRNAVEAMPQGGRLEISVSQEEGATVIAVKDTGIGIPDELLTDVFKTFVTTKPGGMGLGLTYCKRAVEAHGGTIEVESKVGEGTTFTIRL